MKGTVIDNESMFETHDTPLAAVLTSLEIFPVGTRVGAGNLRSRVYFIFPSAGECSTIEQKYRAGVLNVNALALNKAYILLRRLRKETIGAGKQEG